MPMAKIVFDCMPSNVAGGAYDMQYTYSLSGGKTIEGAISCYLGEAIIVSAGADLLEFAVRPD